jgi:hypothetical protein
MTGAHVDDIVHWQTGKGSDRDWGGSQLVRVDCALADSAGRTGTAREDYPGARGWRARRTARWRGSSSSAGRRCRCGAAGGQLQRLSREQPSEAGRSVFARHQVNTAQQACLLACPFARPPDTVSPDLAEEVSRPHGQLRLTGSRSRNGKVRRPGAGLHLNWGYSSLGKSLRWHVTPELAPVGMPNRNSTELRRSEVGVRRAKAALPSG